MEEWAVVLQTVLMQVRKLGWRKYVDDSMLVLLADVTCTLADTIRTFTQGHTISSHLFQGLLKQLMYLTELRELTGEALKKVVNCVCDMLETAHNVDVLCVVNTFHFASIMKAVMVPSPSQLAS